MEIDKKRHIINIYNNIRMDGYRGYDPYDCLNSPIIDSLDVKYSKILFTQFFVYSPINLRRTLGIQKEINPKTMGLLLRSLIMLKNKEMGHIITDIEKDIEYILLWLERNHNKDYSGPCWGYHFPWQDLHKYIPRYEPSIVVTSIIGHAMLDHCLSYKDDGRERFLRGIARFIMNDLNIYRDDDGLCFSYSPHDNNVVHNANLLGAGYLHRLGLFLNDERMVQMADESVNFSLSKQNEDGSWYYSIDPETGRYRSQFDFHQGFVLDCLRMVWDGNKDERILESIKNGLRFYLKMIDDKGMTYYRYPRKWPVDIHNQAQAIITLKDNIPILPSIREKCEKTIDWTLNRMVRPDGRTIHQIWPIIRNTNNYTRWGDSWLLLALVNSL